MKFYIVLRTWERSGLQCFHSRLSGKKSAFNLFFDFPAGRSLPAHPAGHCLPLVLQAAWWLVCLLTPIFPWLSGRVGLLQPHLTGSTPALPVFQILICCFAYNWNRADRFPPKAYIAFAVQTKWLEFPLFFRRPEQWVLMGAFGSWLLLEVCFRLWVLSLETLLAGRWFTAALLE